MSDVVPVVQADRDAAADWRREYSGLDGTAVRSYRSGERDSNCTVQAFARHRIAESARLEAEIERLRGYLPTRFIVLWRKTGEDCLDWDFYVAEDAFEVRNTLANLKKQGVKQVTTYHLGGQVEALADILPETALAADTGEG